MFPLLDLISPVISKVLDFIPDPKMKAEAAAKAQEEADRHQEAIVTALLQTDQAQAAINAKEAESPNVFIAGARPFILWVCGASFAWTFALQPIALFILTASHHPIDNLPQVNMSEMMPVLMGLLGLSGLRTYEKLNNVQGNH